MAKASSVEDFKQISNFQSLRKTLLDDHQTNRLERPLAYWACRTIDDCLWLSSGARWASCWKLRSSTWPRRRESVAKKSLRC